MEAIKPDKDIPHNMKRAKLSHSNERDVGDCKDAKLAGARHFIIEMLEFLEPSYPVDVPLDGDDESLIYGEFKFDDIFGCLSKEWKEDRGVALVAFINEHVQLDDVPSPWNEDREFLLEAVAANSKLWFRLPEALRVGDATVPRLFSSFHNNGMVAAVFEVYPQLSSDRQIWKTILSSNFKVGDQVVQFVDASLLEDRQLMLKLLYKSGKLGQIGPSLLMDRRFIKKVLKTNPTVALMTLPQETKTKFLDLIETTLVRFHPPKRGWNKVSRLEKFGPAICKERFFAKWWFCRGNSFNPDYFPEAWKDDEEIFLWIAKHSSTSDDVRHNFRRSFVHMSQRLKCDHFFMRKAIEYKVEPFRCIPFHLMNDFELVVRALCHGCKLVKNAWEWMNPSSEVWSNFIDQIKMRLEKKVDVFKKFRQLILPALSEVAQTKQTLSYIGLLNQGPETTVVYKRLLAEYLDIPLDVPLEKGYHLYTTALESIKRWERAPQ